MVTREGSGPDHLTTGLFQMGDPGGMANLWGIPAYWPSPDHGAWGRKDTWAHDLILWGQQDHISPCRQPRGMGSIQLGEWKKMPSGSSNLWGKQWDITNSKSVRIPVGPGQKCSLSSSFCLCRRFCLARVPTIYLREKLFLKAFPGLLKHSSNYRH